MKVGNRTTRVAVRRLQADSKVLTF